MTHQTFNFEFFRAFPSLKEVASKGFIYMGDEEPGSYLIFEGVLVPEIDRAAAADPEYLGQLMSFVEEVAQPGFGTCNDLVQIGLGEWLPSSANADKIRAAAGPNTREALWRAERYLVEAERSQNGSPLLSLLRRVILPRKKGA
ncbi:MAG TPA: hypothetical protein VIX42_01100 [Edaphobacter sp.]